jgi:hypothetical protein
VHVEKHWEQHPNEDGLVIAIDMPIAACIKSSPGQRVRYVICRVVNKNYKQTAQLRPSPCAMRHALRLRIVELVILLRLAIQPAQPVVSVRLLRGIGMEQLARRICLGYTIPLGLAQLVGLRLGPVDGKIGHVRRVLDVARRLIRSCAVQVDGFYNSSRLLRHELLRHELLRYWLLRYWLLRHWLLRHRLLRRDRWLRRRLLDTVVSYRDLELLFWLLARQYAVYPKYLLDLLRRSLSITVHR